MKSILRTAAAGLAIASFGVASSASAATDATANVSAEILSNLSITIDATDNTMNFGSIAAENLASGTSTVVLSTSDTAVCGANLVCSGTPSSPTFNVLGQTGLRVGITLPASVTLNRGGVYTGPGSTAMDVGTFVTNRAGNQFIVAAGVNAFRVGGTLTVNALQVPGVYTGSLQVAVQYN